MIFKKIKKNLFFFIFALLIISTFTFFFKPEILRNSIKKILPTETRYKIKLLIFGKEYLDEMRFYYQVNYNQKKIPYTQFEELIINSIDISTLIKENTVSHYKKNAPMKTAFLEVLNNKVVLITSYGEIKILDSLETLDYRNINSNLSENIKIVGTHLEKNKIYLAVFKNTFNDKNEIDCSKLSIVTSKFQIHDKSLDFKDIFTSNDCDGIGTSGGEIVIDSRNKNLYFSTGATHELKEIAQQNDTIYGKIIKLDLADNSYEIYSKGHRNPQGLLITKEGYLISTEHGPYGGDEINKIEKKNYGWPVSSYGEKYSFKPNNDYRFKKNHSKYGFQEPIFTFVPSIGISRIKQIPNNFSSLMQNNYLMGSLNRRSIFRLKFDDEFNKLLFYEEIRVGGRVRDIAYLEDKKKFLLYLEDISKIMTIKSKN
mgnify:CR=1 FL=1